MNGLDDESHLMEKGRTASNEVDWSHVPTKRKKPAKKKVFDQIFSLSQKTRRFVSSIVQLGEKRATTATISEHFTISTAATTIPTKSIGQSRRIRFQIR